MTRWPTWREWGDRAAVVTCRSVVRSLVLGGILEIYAAWKGLT